MTRTLPTNLLAETLRQHNASPWIWLYIIELEATVVSAPTAFLTSVEQEIVFGGRTYSPFPITKAPIATSSSGDLPQTSVTFSNATREFIRYLETSDGLVGRPVTIHLTHKAVYALGESIAWDFEVKGAVANNEAVTLQLEFPDFYRQAMPMDLFVRDRCRHRFKDAATCGYRGSLTGCDKSLNGADGCNARGADEASNGLVVLHPARFGAFPALARNAR